MQIVYNIRFRVNYTSNDQIVDVLKASDTTPSPTHTIISFGHHCE